MQFSDFNNNSLVLLIQVMWTNWDNQWKLVAKSKTINFLTSLVTWMA